MPVPRTLGSCFLLLSLALSAPAADRQVPRWQPQDFAFRSTSTASNPFQVSFAADVTGPAGLSFTMPGFYDGEATWKIRLSPTAPGDWSLVTRSGDPALDGRRISFVCVPPSSPDVHGALRIDPDHPHQFILEDGARIFPMGYECDWLWALDATDPELKTLDPFLDKIKAHGFNFIILNAFAQDTKWRPGRTGDDDFGPPPFYAWEGTNDAPDHSRFNLAYWQHYDRVIDALHRRGLFAHILIKVYNKQVNWPASGSPEDDLYYRWLIARYAAYPTITWDQEANNEKDARVKTDRLRFIRTNDPYHRLLTVHDDKALYDRGVYDDLLDYRSDQQHTRWRETLLDHRKKHPWPVINTEFGYEHGPGGMNDKTYAVVQEPEELCRRAWEVCMAGGFTTYYYTYTAWDVIRPADTPPGYRYFQNLAAFFNRTAYWRLSPADVLNAGAGYCLAETGREYIVFQNAAAPFSLTIENAPGLLHGEWYQPLTGASADAGEATNGVVAFTPPAAWGHGPIALHLSTAPPGTRPK